VIGIGKPVDKVSESDLEALIDSAVPESLTLDFKEQLLLDTPSDKCEFVKDVSSLANKIGGDLLYGIHEADGVAKAIVGITQTNVDATVQTLEQLLRSSIEPRLVGYQIVPIPIRKGGAACILVRIPRSLNGPHRVSHGGHNRFYVRNSNGKHEVSVEELRQMFQAAASAERSADNFRKDRVARIITGQTPIRLNKNDGLLIVHLLPLSALAGSPQAIDPRDAHQIRHTYFSPIGASDQSSTFNFDGCLVYRPARNVWVTCRFFVMVQLKPCKQEF
jgi:hypothetical protein